MHKFELLSIRCKMCDWQWEITPEEKTSDTCCEKCESHDLSIEKRPLHMLKKGGKFITELGYAPERDKYGAIAVEDVTKHFQKPLLIVRENDCKFVEEMTDEDRFALLGKMEKIRSKILQEIKESQDESFQRLG